MDLKWSKGILPPAKDKGGAPHFRKIVAAVLTSYNGRLLAHEYIRSYASIHFLNIVTKTFILHSIGVNEKG